MLSGGVWTNMTGGAIAALPLAEWRGRSPGSQHSVPLSRRVKQRSGEAIGIPEAAVSVADARMREESCVKDDAHPTGRFRLATSLLVSFQNRAKGGGNLGEFSHCPMSLSFPGPSTADSLPFETESPVFYILRT